MSTNFADRVFTNAKVYSVALDGTETRAEAVAIKDGVFAFVGSDADVQALIGPDTVVTNCQGGSILPGLCDAHMHIGLAVRRFGVADLAAIVPDPKVDTPEGVIKQIQDIVAKFAAEHPDDPVVHGSGWERAWFEGNLQGIVRPFTRHDIDAVVSDRPVVLDSFCGHACLVNTAALEAAGYASADTPEPSAGILGRDENGVPNGYIQEPVLIAPICAAIPGYEYTDQQHEKAMLDAMTTFAGMGYTALADCMQMPRTYPVLNQMAKDGKMLARVFGTWPVNDATRKADLETAAANRTMYDVEDLFTVDTVKYFLDGSLAMFEPYTDEHCDANGLPHGYIEPLLWDEQNFMDSVALAMKNNFNVHVHAMGTRGANVTINALVNGKQYDPEDKLRKILAHASFVEPEDKIRMGEEGIICSIQPQWGRVVVENATSEVMKYGAELVAKGFPCKSLMDADILCAFGSDFTVDWPFGLAGIQTAITRMATPTHPDYEMTKDDKPTKPEECCTLKQAIQAHTINGAYQFGVEDRTGSIEVGKSAEMFVLDGDIEAVPANQICSLNVKETLFRGNTTFKA